MKNTFVQDYIDGIAAMHEVDDYVEAWHDGDDERPLHEFLGLTEEEYAIFVVSDGQTFEDLLRRKKLRRVDSPFFMLKNSLHQHSIVI